MPDWIQSIAQQAIGGAVSALVLIAGLRVEVKNLTEKFNGLASSVSRAHTRIDDHIERHHVRRGQ